MAIESKLMQLLPADYGYVMFVGVGSTFVNMWLAINVSRARERYNIPVCLAFSKNSMCNYFNFYIILIVIFSV